MAIKTGTSPWLFCLGVAVVIGIAIGFLIPVHADECKPIEDSLVALSAVAPKPVQMVKVDSAAGLQIIVADMRQQLGDNIVDEEGHDILQSDRFDILVSPELDMGFLVASKDGCYTAAALTKTTHLLGLLKAILGATS